MHLEQTADLRNAVLGFSSNFGEAMSIEIESKSGLLVHWVEYLSAFHRTGTADNLLTAVGSSVRESAGSLSLGLLRQTLFSLRGQIDLMLAWLYFKDHLVEWSHVNDTADGFKLKKELLQYLDQHVPKYGARFAILRDIVTRKEPDPYRMLSAHIHAQSTPVLPAVVNLKDMVQPEAQCKECAEAGFEVAEYLNDVLLSVYLSSWHSIPSPVRDAANARFQTADQRKAFFA